MTAALSLPVVAKNGASSTVSKFCVVDSPTRCSGLAPACRDLAAATAADIAATRLRCIRRRPLGFGGKAL